LSAEQLPAGQVDLASRHPLLVRAVDSLCERLPWCVTGVSALLCDEVGIWCELAKPKHWSVRPDGATVVGLGAVGGSLEPGETLLDCLRRESLEEIGREPIMYSAEATAIVYEQREVRRVAAEPGGLTPALLTVSANVSRHGYLSAWPTLAIVTYWAQLKQEPILADMFGLVRIPIPRATAVLAADEMSWSSLQECVDRVLLTGAGLPERTVVRPVWTIRSLQLALQRAAISLEARVGQLDDAQ